MIPVAAAASPTVNPITRCVRGRLSTSTMPAASSIPSGNNPRPTIDATGHAKNTATKARGTAAA
ncbi:MAG TPA: hypothetical protein VGF99_10620, partial [Myxococcota bacterium]